MDVCQNDLIELLLSRGADPNRPGRPLNIPPLMMCAYQNHVALAKLLLAAGADIHRRCSFGDGTLSMETRQWSALEIARHLDGYCNWRQHQEIIQLLTAASAASGPGGKEADTWR
jgi:ankyrin repeat protein